MQVDVDRVIVGRDAIAAKVRDVARQIAADLGAAEQPELTLVPILTGSIIFVADLIRHLPVPMQVHLVSIRSYPGASTDSRGATLRRQLTDLPDRLTGAHVLIVDDILDSGRTLKFVRDLLLERGPASVRTCVLLRKRHGRRAAEIEADYCCFDVPDVFVVGYGLDYNDYYRNLPDIVTLQRGAMDRHARQAARTATS